MWKRIILILVVLACLAGGAWWLYGDKRTPSDVLTLYGNVDIRQVDVAFRVGGRITELYKEEGDTVKAGEKLAQLDLQPLEYALSRAQAELAMQQAAYAQMLNGYRPEDVAQARASLEGAQAAFNNAAITLRRTENLRKQRALSQRELDDARSAYTEALSRRDAAQEQLRLMEAGYRAEEVMRQEAAV
ncbi:biotin/lipoyl-binding protein, partial [uncultured Bilophila sp.]